MENDKSLVLADPEKSLVLQKVADGLFKSGLFPNAKNVYGAFALVQYGRELGIGPMMSLKNINLISGQLACNAQLMLSLAMAKGVSYEVVQESNQGCKIVFKRPNCPNYTAEFTEADAKEAGLLGKDNWRKYPRDMYFWRAVAKGIRRIAPDATLGLYTVDEISEGVFSNVEEVPPPEAAPTLAEENTRKVVSPEQEAELTPPQTPFGKFLSSMSGEKARVGVDNYYEALQLFGFTHANEIKEREKQVAVYKALKNYQQDGGKS